MKTTTAVTPPRQGPAHQKSPWRPASFLALCTVLSLTVVGCTTGGNAANSENSGTDTIRSTMIANPNGFNPLTSTGVPSTMANSLLYGTLLAPDDNYTFAGDLAAQWELTPAKGTFTLREGSTCADGTEITAEVVKNSLDAFVKTSSNKGLVFGPSTPKITADNSTRTVSIELEQPWADMGQGLSMPETGIICPAGLEDPEGTAAGKVEGAFSGPYTLADYQPGVNVEFAKRDQGYTWPEYNVPFEGQPAKTIKYSISSDYNSIANGLLTDQIDVATVLGEPMERFASNDKFATERFSTANLFMVFNEREGKPFDDPDARRAVAKAVDQEAFTQAATNGLGTASTSFVSSAVQCANTDTALLVSEQADLEKLKGLTGTLVGTPAIGKGAGNTYVSQVLNEAGADIKLRTVDTASLVTELNTKPDSWDLTVVNLVNISSTMYAGISRFTGPTTEDGGRNITGDSHQEYLALVGQAMAETDQEKRCGIYQKIQQGLFEDGHVIPLADVAAQLTTAEGFSARIINGISSARTMRILP